MNGENSGESNFSIPFGVITHGGLENVSSKSVTFPRKKTYPLKTGIFQPRLMPIWDTILGRQFGETYGKTSIQMLRKSIG